jgi:ribose 5-phosphate isomerase A
VNPKKLAAERAVDYIKEGMVVGLGTGSTSYWAIHAIAQKVHEGLNIRAVASSKQSEELAAQLGISLISFAEIERIDITIDGADEVDNHSNLIKGGGGALLREKILASNSNEMIVIVDESKQVEHLGKFPLPVEIVPFASNLTVNQLRNLHCEAMIRRVNGEIFVTDNGNLIVDCSFELIREPDALSKQINLIPGVVENGLFTQLASKIVVGFHNGTVKIIE